MCIRDRVEPVGDPAGDDVGQHPGEGVLVEDRQRLLEFVGERAHRLGVHGPEPVGGSQVGTGLGTEDHRHRLPIELAMAIAGVIQGPRGDLETE